MVAEQAEWEKLTPEQLRPAVKHIRESSDTANWKCSEVTRHLCYAALHPQASDLTTLGPYKRAFATYRNIVGPVAHQQFEDLIGVATPPSIFKGYLDLYRKGVEVNAQNQFNQILQVGLVNAALLKMHPVDWAKSHLDLLNNGNAHLVRLWIMRTCDKQDFAKTQDFEEMMSWSTWRAPMLIHMQPSGNTPYDPETAWKREDETRTQKLLEGLSRRFIEYGGFELDRIAGQAHVRFAQIRKYTQVIRPAKEDTDLTAPSGQEQPKSTKATKSDPRERAQREAVILKVKNPQAHTVLSTPEAALYFEVQTRTIHRWTDEGKLRRGAKRGSITIASIRQWEKKRSRKLPPL